MIYKTLCRKLVIFWYITWTRPHYYINIHAMTSLLVKSQLCVILSVELANPLGAAEFANKYQISLQKLTRSIIMLYIVPCQIWNCTSLCTAFLIFSDGQYSPLFVQSSFYCIAKLSN
jgi:hypothetical protein